MTRTPLTRPDGIHTINPATQEPLAFHPFVAETALEEHLARSRRAFVSWRATSLTQRIAHLDRFAHCLHERQEMLALEATREMGKPISAARAEVQKCIALFAWYKEHAARLLADRKLMVPDGEAWALHEPLGVILAIMPWNFPYWQIMRAAVPIMLGGNAILVKPAENTFHCGALLGQAAREAGLNDIFSVANFSRPQTEKLIADRRISGVSVTGSLKAGQHIASLAGAAGKKSLLELGGSDPFIVFKDADLTSAIDAAVASRYANCGQVCVAAKRIIVEKPLYQQFSEGFTAKVRDLSPADPMEASTFIGPMARLDLRDALHDQVSRTLSEGGVLLCGGQKIDQPGAWYQPSVISAVTPQMTAFREEIFGPVAALIEAEGEAHAIALANQSDYGLSASIWSADVARARQTAQSLETGSVFINKVPASHPACPFGGIKNSGYGRELAEYGLYEFLNIKTVWMS